ncbi:taste receptor type 2 member 14-like [Lepus europaeus]|uniref:taste receptor type 2 member 14-like n=1 Tax=Lepus europaeus TaxID=9983 RepID=UPI002B46BD6B|nr:taste receptor type 2 member 14-like [Lepus europaeus]
MNTVILSIVTVILGVEFIIGNTGNGFIVMVNFIDWVKRRKVSSVDQLLMALATSRICLLWIVLLSKLSSVLCPFLFWTEEILKMINVTWTTINHFSVWLATCLSIFYFLKIANFSNSTFLYLKWRAEKVVLVTLLVSVVILFLNITLTIKEIDIWVAGYKINKTCSSSSKDSLYFSRDFLLNYLVFTIIPFTVSLITFLLLIFSLYRHLRKMHLSAAGSRDASTKAHFQSLQTVVAFLLLYAVLFLSLFMQVLISELWRKNAIIMLCHVFAMTFPSSHSCVLILRNKKLRQAYLSLVWWLRCKFKDAES